MPPDHSLDHDTITLTQRHPALGAAGTLAFGMFSLGTATAMIALALMVGAAWVSANWLVDVFSIVFEGALYADGVSLLAMFAIATVQGLLARQLTRPLALRLFDNRLEIDDGRSVRRLPLATTTARLRTYRRATADLLLSAPGAPELQVSRLMLDSDEQSRLLSTIRSAIRAAQQRHGGGEAEVPPALRAMRAEQHSKA